MSVGSFEHNLHRGFKSQVEKVIEMTYFTKKLYTKRERYKVRKIQNESYETRQD